MSEVLNFQVHLLLPTTYITVWHISLKINVARAVSDLFYSGCQTVVKITRIIS
jgi:hypothetical protein